MILCLRRRAPILTTRETGLGHLALHDAPPLPPSESDPPGPRTPDPSLVCTFPDFCGFSLFGGLSEGAPMQEMERGRESAATGPIFDEFRRVEIFHTHTTPWDCDSHGLPHRPRHLRRHRFQNTGGAAVPGPHALPPRRIRALHCLRRDYPILQPHRSLHGPGGRGRRRRGSPARVGLGRELSRNGIHAIVGGRGGRGAGGVRRAGDGDAVRGTRGCWCWRATGCSTP